jgi:hypothetical protein
VEFSRNRLPRCFECVNGAFTAAARRFNLRRIGPSRFFHITVPVRDGTFKESEILNDVQALSPFERYVITERRLLATDSASRQPRVISALRALYPRCVVEIRHGDDQQPRCAANRRCLAKVYGHGRRDPQRSFHLCALVLQRPRICTQQLLQRHIPPNDNHTLDPMRALKCGHRAAINLPVA